MVEVQVVLTILHPFRLLGPVVQNLEAPRKGRRIHLGGCEVTNGVGTWEERTSNMNPQQLFKGNHLTSSRVKCLFGRTAKKNQDCFITYSE